MRIRLLQEQDAKLWDEYVLSSDAASCYHLTAWKQVVEKSFHLRTFYFMVTKGDAVVGILPLVLMNSILFGRFLVSLPFFNYGGICADDEEVRALLLQEAIALAKQERATHLELRHCAPSNLGLVSKTAKVAMILDLPSTPEALRESFRTKLRSQIKRAERENMEVRLGGLDLLEDFYRVFSRNMRDLGTPVYSRGFFKNILDIFPTNTKIVSVLYKHMPVASGFLISFKGRVEIPWASSIREYNSLAPNMLLYWHALKFSCETGNTSFDFGRSTVDSPTYNFKKQWGTQPLQLYWDYWLGNGVRLPEINPNNRKYKLLISLWKRMPLPFSRVLGPRVVQGIP